MHRWEEAIASHSYDTAVGWWDDVMMLHDMTLRSHDECHSHFQVRMIYLRTKYAIVHR